MKLVPATEGARVRRKELEITDPAQLAEVLTQADWGLLSMQGPDGWPYSVPMNFVFKDGKLYVHGAMTGKKLDLLKADTRVQFTVVQEYARIPSYATGPSCSSATQFFKSVMVRGRAELVLEPARKVEVFQALMTKYQPEGGYAPLDLLDPRAAAMLKATALIAIEPIETTGKFKFGQNLPEEKAAALIDLLQKRAAPGDADTIACVQKYRPGRGD